jgi:hypothetical protein
MKDIKRKIPPKFLTELLSKLFPSITEKNQFLNVNEVFNSFLGKLKLEIR